VKNFFEYRKGRIKEVKKGNIFKRARKKAGWVEEFTNAFKHHRRGGRACRKDEGPDAGGVHQKGNEKGSPIEGRDSQRWRACEKRVELRRESIQKDCPFEQERRRGGRVGKT